jgi:hypothetical protein
MMLAKGILPTAFFACILKIFRKYRESLPSLACSADDTVLWIASSSVFTGSPHCWQELSPATARRTGYGSSKPARDQKIRSDQQRE